MLIFEKRINGPAAHAIVIGVGYYRHLLGGDPNKLFSKHGGLGQLTSPPHSARALTDWLLTKFKNTNTPLASVELLISENGNGNYTVAGESKPINGATLQRVKTAARGWKERGDSNKDNLMLFFFCGHGVLGGYSTTLLLEDFGEIDYAPFENSIDFNAFHRGMDKCAARKQCYFVDACRVSDTKLIESLNYYGDPIITPCARVNLQREAPVFYSTWEGGRAAATPNTPSLFTELLLKSFNGAGSHEATDGWQVTTNYLNVGLTELMEPLYGSESGQSCRGSDTGKLLLHEIEGNPIIPVIVSCIPSAANSSAQMSYSSADGSRTGNRKKAEPSDWIVDIETGKYRFSADFPGGAYNSNSAEEDVEPPFEKVPIRV